MGVGTVMLSRLRRSGVTLLFGLGVVAITVPAFGTLPGQPAPGFSLQDEDAGWHSLKDNAGKIIVLEWTNPGCPFVKRHYREKTMVQTLERYADKNVVWLAVDSSHFATPERAQQWAKEHGLPYATLIDVAGGVGKLYGAVTTPHMFVIGTDGAVKYSGAIDDDPWGEKPVVARGNHVAEAVDALLAGKDPPRAETDPYGCSVKYRK